MISRILKTLTRYSTESSSVVQQQRALIEHLIQTNNDQLRHNSDLTTTVEKNSSQLLEHVEDLVRRSAVASELLVLFSDGLRGRNQQHWTSSETSLPVNRNIMSYCNLISKLLAEVDLARDGADENIVSRVRQDVVQTHKRESRSLQKVYGYSKLKNSMRSDVLRLANLDSDNQLSHEAKRVEHQGNRSIKRESCDSQGRFSKTWKRITTETLASAELDMLLSTKADKRKKRLEFSPIMEVFQVAPRTFSIENEPRKEGRSDRTTQDASTSDDVVILDTSEPEISELSLRSVASENLRIV